MSEPAAEKTIAGAEGETVAEQLQELTRAVADLKAELRRGAGPALPRDERAGWDDEAPQVTQSWVSALAPPRPAPPTIPRLPIELAFIAAAAVLAGVADLRPAEIAGVMAAAWVVVALAEWAASRGDRLRWQVYLAPVAAPEPQAAAPAADPSWFTPPVEHTLLGPREEQATAVVAVVAVASAADDPEATAERRPDA